MELLLQIDLKDGNMVTGHLTKERGQADDVKIVSNGAKLIRRLRHAREDLLWVYVVYLNLVQVQ